MKAEIIYFPKPNFKIHVSKQVGSR